MYNSRVGWAVFRNREYLIDPEPQVPLEDPDPGGQLVRDIAESGSYFAFFLAIEKICCQIVLNFLYEK
jgi:hypothetical protein